MTWAETFARLRLFVRAHTRLGTWRHKPCDECAEPVRRDALKTFLSIARAGEFCEACWDLLDMHRQAEHDRKEVRAAALEEQSRRSRVRHPGAASDWSVAGGQLLRRQRH